MRNNNCGKDGKAGPGTLLNERLICAAASPSPASDKGVPAISKPRLDDHDEAIIACLREDGRMAIRDLAIRVQLNEATVRARIRKLEQSGTMRVVARLDLGAVGYPFTALVGVRLRGRSVEDVCKDLLALPEVISVLSVIGRNDLEIQVIAPSLEDLNRQLTEVIPAIDGIVALESALAMKIYKYVQPWGRFDEGD